MSQDNLAFVDEQAEQSLLGAVLIGGRNAYDAVTTIGAGDFFFPRHGYIWDAIHELVESNTEIDNVTIESQLRTMGKWGDSGGVVYIMALMSYVPNWANIADYARIVKHCSVMRQIVRVGKEMVADATTGVYTPSELLASATNALESVTLPQNSPKFTDVLQNYVDKVAEMWQTGADTDVVKWGFPSFDKLLAPMKRGEMSMVVGVTNSGKSLLVANLIHQWLNKNVPVGLISLEMDSPQILDRMTAIGTGIHPAEIIENPHRTREQWDKMTAYWKDLAKRPFYLSDKPMEMGDVLGQLREWQMASPDKKGVRVLVVDYAGLITPSDVDRRASFFEKMSAISNALKQLAMKQGISILTVMQINRDGFNRPPTLDHVSGSIRFAQDASTVIAVHPVKDDFEGRVDILHLKSRDKACGHTITFKRVGTRFFETRSDDTTKPTF